MRPGVSSCVHLSANMCSITFSMRSLMDSSVAVTA